jgi:hypothetical protein
MQAKRPPRGERNRRLINRVFIALDGGSGMAQHGVAGIDHTLAF